MFGKKKSNEFTYNGASDWNEPVTLAQVHRAIRDVMDYMHTCYECGTVFSDKGFSVPVESAVPSERWFCRDHKPEYDKVVYNVETLDGGLSSSSAFSRRIIPHYYKVTEVDEQGQVLS